jgi:hypothetical protein
VLSRVPGLLVLHDLVLHHARAAQLLDSEPVRAWRLDPSSAAAREAARPSLEAWRDELEYSYPGRGEALFEVHLGTVGDLLPYAYPLFRMPVEASRAVAVHNAFMAAAVREEVPGQGGRPPPDARAGRARRSRGGARAARAPRHRGGGRGGGGVRPAHSREARRLGGEGGGPRRGTDGRLRLLLVGPVPDRARLDAEIDRLGLGGRTVVTGRVPLAELATHVEAADVVAHLRYPTARETSAALLRVLAQGRARRSSRTSSTRPTCPRTPWSDWTRPTRRAGSCARSWPSPAIPGPGPGWARPRLRT